MKDGEIYEQRNIATSVIAYDDYSGHYAARLFWILEYLGNRKARILNGGIRKWVSEKAD